MPCPVSLMHTAGAMDSPARQRGRTHAADSVVRPPDRCHAEFRRGWFLSSGMLRIDPACSGGSHSDSGCYGCARFGSDSYERERSDGSHGERGAGRGGHDGQFVLRPGLLRLLNPFATAILNGRQPPTGAPAGRFDCVHVTPPGRRTGTQSALREERLG